MATLHTSPLRRNLAFALALCYAALIFRASSAPVPDLIAGLPVPDLLLHMAEYAVLGLLLARWFFHETLRTGVVALVLLPALVAGAYGVTDELHQSVVDARDASWADLWADLAGGMLGAFAYRLFLRLRIRRSERTAPALACVLALAAGAGVLAGESDSPGRFEREVRLHRSFLRSHELKGMGGPFPGNAVAARYVAEKLRGAGLTPAGDDGGWFIREKRVVREDRKESFVRFMVGKDTVSLSGDGVGISSHSGEGEGAGPLCFAGYGLVVPEWRRDDYRSIEVKGKVVVLFAGLPAGVPPEKADLSEAGRIARARGEGAVAVVVIGGKAIPRWSDPARGGFPALTVAGEKSREFAKKLGSSIEELRTRADGKSAAFDAPGVVGVVRAVTATAEHTLLGVAGLLPGAKQGAEPVLVAGRLPWRGREEFASELLALAEALARDRAKPARPVHFEAHARVVSLSEWVGVIAAQDPDALEQIRESLR